MKRILLSLLSLTTFNISAEIYTTSNIIDVHNYITSPKTLVAFDVDCTLGIPFPHFNPTKRLYLLENDSLDLLNLFKKFNVNACVLTARTFDEHTKTVDQLSYNNLEFAQLTPFAELCSEIDSSNGPCKVIHANGVICAGWCPKGIALRTIIEKSSYKPDTVIFVDDKLSNIESVEQELKPLGIIVIGVHYTRVMGGYELKAFKPVSRFFKKHKQAAIATATGTAMTAGIIASIIAVKNWLPKFAQSLVKI